MIHKAVFQPSFDITLWVSSTESVRAWSNKCRDLVTFGGWNNHEKTEYLDWVLKYTSTFKLKYLKVKFIIFSWNYRQIPWTLEKIILNFPIKNFNFRCLWLALAVIAAVLLFSSDTSALISWETFLFFKTFTNLAAFSTLF